MKQCKGVIARQDPLEPIGRCGAQTDRSYCPRCAGDPAQAFWSDVLRAGWDQDLASPVNRLLTAPKAAPKPKPRPKKKKPPHKPLMTRAEARKVLLGT